MHATAQLIADKALSLPHEAIQFPETAPTALAWLGRAVDRAEKDGLTELAGTLRRAADRIRNNEAEMFTFEDAALPMWAGEGEV